MRGSTQAIKQFFGCARTLYAIPCDVEKKLEQDWDNSLPSSVSQWYDTFYRDVFISRNGYPCHEPFSHPYTEDFISTFFKEQGVLADIIPHKPTLGLCLSHDVDHLAPTLRLQLKTWVSSKSFKLLRLFDTYIDSLEKLLIMDAQVKPWSNDQGTSTLFLAAPRRASSLSTRLKQYIIDPTYNTHHPLFQHLKDLIKKYRCIVGLHGSFFSIKEGFLEEEKKDLENALDTPINFSRQHWLNLPAPDSLQALGREFHMDSTLGWNGSYGLRGGMVRPFPVILANDKIIWELPLLLMDGPLFCDLKLSPDQILKTSQTLLAMVKERQGCVSINWHERAAHLDYNWHGVYQEILNYATQKEFNFLNIAQIKGHYIG